MNVVGQNGVELSEKWDDGVKTYLGMCVAGFPNMFFTYGPQAPTALCNGPSCAELQGEWVVDALKTVRGKGLRTINAAVEAEKTWAEGITAIANMSLLPTTKSWYMVRCFSLEIT
jgi:cation diffusion facilitator CzcD-associated flavoprotein CzcO